MRIRSIKPEFYRSDDISVLSWDERLIFIGLWSYVDDNGVGMDRLASITADLFSGDIERDSSETFARVSRGLQTLAEAGRITRYTVDGKKYLHITNWSKHQRIDKPNKERYPLPTCDDAGIVTENATPSRQSRDTPATGTGEQGNRGTGESKNPTSDADASDQEATGFSDEVEALCQHLAAHITRNGNKPGTIGIRWKQAADRLIRIDEYTPDQIRQVIDWSQQDEFWQGNILSMPKLREKFDTLKTRMLNERQREQNVVHLDHSARGLAKGAALLAKLDAQNSQFQLEA